MAFHFRALVNSEAVGVYARVHCYYVGLQQVLECWFLYWDSLKSVLCSRCNCFVLIDPLCFM